ncbi:MAG: RNB domain-containing ribonuclease, partial [Beijerinckiaceae bacterium]
MAGAENLPTREAIAEFVATQTTKVGKREIAKAFGIKGGARIALKRLLQEMADEGQFEKRGKRLHKAGALPPVLLCDIVSRDRDGDLWAAPVDWDADQSGPAPRIRVTVPRKPRPGQPAAGVKDRALLRLWNDGADAYSGRVIKLIERARHQALGVFRANKDGHGGGIIEPVDKKSLGRILRVNPGDEEGAKDGDLVSASLGPTPRLGPPLARVKERLGSITSEKAISLIALEAHGIPTRFAPATLEESEAAEPASLKGREDWRDIPLLTIDPPDAKDHDDAVFAEADTDPANAGGYVVTVAIADVAAYVRFGSSMDREASERGNSVYFPDR